MTTQQLVALTQQASTRRAAPVEEIERSILALRTAAQVARNNGLHVTALRLDSEADFLGKNLLWMVL